jgi:prevent-host-death family protein
MQSHDTHMQAVTIREAKARLNALVEAAERGEQVVLMRGSKHVAAIVPLSEADLEVSPRLTDAQAERLWGQIAAERRDGVSVLAESAEAAVAVLGTPKARQSRVPRARTAGKRKRHLK